MREQDTSSSKCTQKYQQPLARAKPLVHSLSPMFSVGSYGFLNLCVDLQGFDVSIADILEGNLWSACETSSLRQLFVKELLCYLIIVRSDNLTKPAYSSLL